MAALDEASATDPRRVLPYPEVRDAGLTDWRYLVGVLHARFATGDFAAGVAFVGRIGAVADEADHHPDVDLTYPCVYVRLVSHDVGGITSRDLDLARQISRIAADFEIAATPEQTTALEIALDVPDAATVRDFWAAVLDYRVTSDDEVTDPAGHRAALWFQGAPDATGEAPQRFHYDVVVPPETAQRRVEAAVAAGGTLVTDRYAPAFWVLQDAHGNKVCVCTPEGRVEE
jgi:4a-hydroxytetrahydrobiopterin dehydratase